MKEERVDGSDGKNGKDGKDGKDKGRPRPLLRLEHDFLAQGGLRERMTLARLDARSAARNRSHNSHNSHSSHSSHGHSRGRGKPNLPSNEGQGEQNGTRK